MPKSTHASVSSTLQGEDSEARPMILLVGQSLVNEGVLFLKDAMLTSIPDITSRNHGRTPGLKVFAHELSAFFMADVSVPVETCILPCRNLPTLGLCF